MSFRKQYRDYCDLYAGVDDPPPFVPRITELEWEVEEDILKSLMKKEKKYQLKLGMDTKLPYTKSVYNRVEDWKEKTKDFFLITINPKEEFWTGDKFNYFFNQCLKLQTYRWTEEFYLFFEQRGESNNELGKGAHAHIVLTKHKTERKRLIDNLNSCFSRICGEPFINTINVKNKKFGWLEETLNEYLIEQKKDDDKLNKVKFDAIWRNEMNIQNKYYWNSNNVGLTIDKRPTKYSTSGGARTGAGVKKGDKRGKYKKKEKTGTTVSKIPTPEHIVDWKNENVILEF